jgi:hypothetical protein
MALQTVTFPMEPLVKIHLIINCVLVFIALFIVGLRLFARFTSGANLWWDDYLILLSVPQGIGMLIIQGLCRASLPPKMDPIFNKMVIDQHEQIRRWELDSPLQRRCQILSSS